MKIRSTVIKAIYVLWVAILTYYFLPLYTDDDQYLYKLYYENLNGLAFNEGFLHYGITLGASEPLYFILTYYASSWITKHALIILLNLLLAYKVVSYIVASGRVVNIFFALTNFYLLVLYFSHERLKFAALVFLLICDIKWINGYIKIMVVVSSHFQFMLIYVYDLINYKTLRNNIIYSALGVVCIVGILYLFKDAIIAKYIIYSSEVDLYKISESITKIFILSLIGLLYSDDVKKYLTLQFIMLSASIIVGGDRIVIFSYFILMHAYLSKKYVKIAHQIPIYMLNLYFSFKGLQFLYNILDHGHGF